MKRRAIEPSEAEVSAFVAQHPHGASFREVAGHFGMTHQGIQLVEVRALVKLARRLHGRRLEGIDDMI